MIGIKKIAPAIEKGTEAIKQADASIRTVIVLSALSLVVALVTLGVVVSRG